jgi:GH24 family phage-related lysozyme (muramidase)
MKIIAEDWASTLKSAWSVRALSICLIAALFIVFDQVLPDVAPDWLGQTQLAIVMAVSSVAGLIARIVVQQAATAWAAGLVRRFVSSESGAMPVRKRTAAVGAAAVIALATPFIAKWEGVRLEAYRDVVGVATICFGDTHGVQMGDRATMAECVDRLEDDVASFYAQIAPCMTRADIPVSVQASMLELAFNVGARPVCRSTMMRRANAGQYVLACDELRKWVYAGGRRWPGLENRRADSKENLCLSGI